jgi:2-keto-4-pentenoate hydratase/2-oxohepta-3-ene-1,7-dioic acid hydratase in catechol pathway
MKIANFEAADGLRQGIGIALDDGLLDFNRAFGAFQAVLGEYQEDYLTIQEMIESGRFELELFQEVMEFVEATGLADELMVEEGYKLLAPIPRPPAIYALGRNFPAHAMEHAGKVPTEPIVFGKAATSVIGPEEPVVYKKFLTRVDPEAELAVIIGAKGSNIPEEEASDYIAGYTIVNDVTARDIQHKDIASAHPWFRSKGLDTFCPMGPWVTLTDEIQEPVELEIEMRVNGEIRQKDNTRNLTFKIPYLISWISQYFTLYPGDVIATGTPEGMKPVVPGDVMEVSVEKIGILRNPVVAEQ